MTHQYELMVILDPEIDERTVAPSLDKFLNVIRNDGGTVDNVDIWGRRRLGRFTRTTSPRSKPPRGARTPPSGA